MSQFFASGGQSVGASASVLPMNIQDWFLQDGLVGSPCSPRDSQESSPTPQFKSINSFALSFLIVQLSHPYMTTGKTIALTRQTFVGKVMSLLFNMLSRLFITFLPRSKRLLISWLQSPSSVILEQKKKKFNLSLFPLFHSLFPLIYFYSVSLYWIMNGFKNVLYMISSMFTFICSDNRYFLLKSCW